MRDAFDDLASHILSLGMGTIGLKNRSMDYRKGKTRDDLCNAVRRGIKLGRGKTEFEITMIAVQIRRVLRIVKPKKLKLTCPNCQERHIDSGEWATRIHRKHKCESCDHIWQPSENWTVGV